MLVIVGIRIFAIPDALIILMNSQLRLSHIEASTQTWYLVRRVLQQPVSSIMATKNGIRALSDILKMAVSQSNDLMGLDTCPIEEFSCNVLQSLARSVIFYEDQ